VNPSIPITQPRMAPFKELFIWNDIHPHSGEYNMAMDELLLEQAAQTNRPILRFYHWSTPTISLGYFQSYTEAKSVFCHDTRAQSDSTPHIVRRWTGGGIVNHTDDYTYTLAIPLSHPLAAMRGAKTYQTIHQALALSLQAQDIPCSLTNDRTPPTSAACFTNPVPYDILSPTLTRYLASKPSAWQPPSSLSKAAQSLAKNKYATKQWLQKR